MYIDLKCKECGKIFSLDFSENEIQNNSCPNCGHSFNYLQLDHLAEVYYSTQRHLNEEVELIAVSTGEKNYIYNTYLDNINRLFNRTDKATQEKLSYLLDVFYLLINKDVKNADIESLSETKNEIRKLYNKKVGNPENFMINGNYEID